MLDRIDPTDVRHLISGKTLRRTASTRRIRGSGSNFFVLVPFSVRSYVLGLLGLLLLSGCLQRRTMSERPEVFMWNGAGRIMERQPAVFEGMMRFAARQGIVPYANGVSDSTELRRYLEMCERLSVRTAWIEIGPRTDATAPEFATSRDRFLKENGSSAMNLRLTSADTSDASRFAAAYAMPYRPTRHYTTEAKVTRLIEKQPRWIAVNSLARHVRPVPDTLRAESTTLVSLPGTRPLLSNDAPAWRDRLSQ